LHLVVGLGNPGREYERNRHNVGFMVVEALRREAGLPEPKEKFKGTWAKGPAFGGELAVLFPQTFMNLSGESVQPCAAFLKVAPAHVVVVHDELDLPFGDVRVKVGGGHAGHNGLRSLIGSLGTPDFVRVRVGIGRPPPGFRGDVADYVLGDFDAAERAELPGVIDRAVLATKKVLTDGPGAAQSDVHGKGGKGKTRG
jgi:PTH1 family peptidyl-tRNA hydrolase